MFSEVIECTSWFGVSHTIYFRSHPPEDRVGAFEDLKSKKTVPSSDLWQCGPYSPSLQGDSNYFRLLVPKGNLRNKEHSPKLCRFPLSLLKQMQYPTAMKTVESFLNLVTLEQSSTPNKVPLKQEQQSTKRANLRKNLWPAKLRASSNQPSWTGVWMVHQKDKLAE